MGKTSNIYVRVEPNIKEQAEIVLEQLGIPMSNAVSIFLRQVVMQNGLPFEVKIHGSRPIAIADMSEAQFNMEMLKAQNDFEKGKTYSLEEVENELKKELLDEI
ncbi:MAG: type II toxin-antitoxin system RelB/DinJ family antitoxin [Clostridiales bacterium]|nr:type II toxin-antitoxin system RelB/DinJ family antitoxin [Clostridiales bacterium]MDY6116488.1 type II toxin-antitoxin system RelB/DinJ family antitoxin [Anaerovoracaceae bacterium]